MEKSEAMQVSCPAVHSLSHCFRMLCATPFWLNYLPFSLLYIVYQRNLALNLKPLFGFVFVFVFYFQTLFLTTRLIILCSLLPHDHPKTKFTQQLKKICFCFRRNSQRFIGELRNFISPLQDSAMTLIYWIVSAIFGFLCHGLCPLTF